MYNMKIFGFWDMYIRPVAAEFVYGLYSIFAHYAHKPAEFTRDTKNPDVFLEDVPNKKVRF